MSEIFILALERIHFSWLDHQKYLSVLLWHNNKSQLLSSESHLNRDPWATRDKHLLSKIKEEYLFGYILVHNHNDLNSLSLSSERSDRIICCRRAKYWVGSFWMCCKSIVRLNNKMTSCNCIHWVPFISRCVFRQLVLSQDYYELLTTLLYFM